MEVTSYTVPQPRSKKAALRLAGSLVLSNETLDKKKGNLTMKENEIRAKITRLQNQLIAIDKTRKGLDATTSNNQKAIDDLKTEFLLTETEILTVRSELLGKQIRKLKQLSGAEEDGTTRYPEG